jgi:hypothetical protein
MEPPGRKVGISETERHRCKLAKGKWVLSSRQGFAYPFAGQLSSSGGVKDAIGNYRYIVTVRQAFARKCPNFGTVAKGISGNVMDSAS